MNRKTKSRRSRQRTQQQRKVNFDLDEVTRTVRGMIPTVPLTFPKIEAPKISFPSFSNLDLSFSIDDFLEERFGVDRHEAYDYITLALRGLIVAIVAASLIFVGYPPQAAFDYFDPKLGRQIRSYYQQVWSTLCIGLCDPILLVKTGEFPDSSDVPKLLICNHVTDIDWVYMWVLAQRTKGDRSGHVKIIMKQGMRDVPLFGLGMELFNFIFLKRDWDEDKDRLKSSIKNLCKVKDPVWIILFPEGMTMNLKSMEKSKDFAAQKEGAPDLNHTLLPRVRGFEHIMELLRKYGGEPEIFDMTMEWEGFKGEIPTWEQAYSREEDIQIPNFFKLMSGTCTNKCYLNSEKFSMDDIQSYNGGTEQWLFDRWARKDKMLAEFIETGEFEGEEEYSYDGDSVSKVVQAMPMTIAAFFEIVLIFSILRTILF